MAFVVVFRPRAQRDITTTMAGPGWSGLAAMDRWRIGLVTSVVTKLEHDPHCYAQADEAADLGVDLREMLHGRRRHVYRVLFTVDGETVSVHRIRHAAQDRLTQGDL